jgi:hypothetical protein
MHRTDPAGHVIESLCDYCRRTWQPDGDEIMIEGHQGSLICLKCLSAAYSAVSLHKLGSEHSGTKCTMCIEDRDQSQWESPLYEGVRVCLRCIKQAATALEKDPETGWKRPTAS